MDPGRQADIKCACEDSSTPVEMTTNGNVGRQVDYVVPQTDITRIHEDDADVKHITTRQNGGGQVDPERQVDIKCIRDDNDEHQVDPGRQ